MKENYLERPSARAGNPYPGAFYEGELPEKAFRELAILILVHFMKENCLERPSASWKSLEILILVQFMKENYLERPSASWKSLSWCIL